MKTRPFMTINEASRATGISTYMLRRRCRDRTIPCIPLGDDESKPTKYIIDFDGLVAQLRAEAAQNVVEAPVMEREEATKV